MLVLAPAACIMSGIALSEAFDVLTRSIKFQLPGLLGGSQVNVCNFLFQYASAVTLSSVNHLKDSLIFGQWFILCF